MFFCPYFSHNVNLGQLNNQCCIFYFLLILIFLFYFSVKRLQCSAATVYIKCLIVQGLVLLHRGKKVLDLIPARALCGICVPLCHCGFSLGT